MAVARKHATGGMVAKRLATMRASAMVRKLALFDSILESMSQGYCVFDAELRLVSYNARYVELLGFDPDFIHPGLEMAEVLRDLAWRGDFGAGDIEKIVVDRLAFHGGPEKSLEFERVRANGAVLAICRRPMPEVDLSPPSPTSRRSAAFRRRSPRSRACSRRRCITCRTASSSSTRTRNW
jgi:PAS domain-containing protein